MRIAIRSSLTAAVVAAGFALATAPAANAQVSFQGSFPLPHGRISVNLPDPFFPLRSFVPDGYSVYDDAQYGDGFYDGDDWVPCERFGGRWVIAGSPFFVGRRHFRSVAPFRNDVRFFSPFRRDFDNRFDGRFRRRFDDRRDARFDRRSRERFDSGRDQRFTRNDWGRGQERRFSRDSRDGRDRRDRRDSRGDSRRWDR